MRVALSVEYHFGLSHRSTHVFQVRKVPLIASRVVPYSLYGNLNSSAVLRTISAIFG